jgi:tRNA(Ile)-lysidine synthase
MHGMPAWGGSFRVTQVHAGGIPVSAASRLDIRSRAAGDRFQAGVRRPPRSLKLQFQQRGIEPGLRDGPVVCRDGDLVFVPGLGLDARALADVDEAQVTIEWLPD